ncbi:TonB-dependent receptor [Niabella hibiscisoli]|uniref:TonB-dependent receptor n=1 Tax=Niabella hibiscisoli TaxID=1825928 RepID=UPI001F113954|nr:TonB-dependent receptor plug domain-containing protein [Niabella hibiscisoli]MCH5720679.1 Plug domain-containing protein [Niabella hibiscisoli]
MRLVNSLKLLRNCVLQLTCLVSSLFAAAQDIDTAQSVEDTLLAPATNGVTLMRVGDKFKGSSINEVPLNYVIRQPYISVQQYLKGNAAGVYVQETSGEPGTEQNMFIRGISAPLLSKRELFDQQPTVFVNGVPLTQDNPFAYEIQKYDFNRIGPATNLLAAYNQDNIESIEVIKGILWL